MPSLLIALLATQPALADREMGAKDLRVPGVDIIVHVPAPPEGQVQPWGWTMGDASMDTRLSMRNSLAYTDVTFAATQWEPDLSINFSGLAEQLLPMDDEDLSITPMPTERVEHPKLGTVIELPADVHDNWMERDLWSRTALFAIGGSGVVLRATSAESAERANEVLNQVLDMIEVTTPALTRDHLPYGKVTTESGFIVELPTGWRALTDEETQRISSGRIGGENDYSAALAWFYVVDTSKLSEAVFACRADSTGTLEILDPERAPKAGENFRTFAEVLLQGGRYRLAQGRDELFVDVLTETPIQPTKAGEVKLVKLADREAYSMRFDGTYFQDPVQASVFYVTYGDIGLSCIASAKADNSAVLTTFDQVMAGMQIVDPEKHPMPLSLRGRYVRWWPTTNPAMQLYWLPLPLFLIAGWLILRDD